RARRHWRLAGCPTTEPREIHLAASGRCACEPERATATSAGARAALATAGRTRHHRRVVAIGVCANGAPRGLHGKLAAMNSPIPSLDSMNAAALRTMVLELLAEHGDLQQELALTQQLLTRQDQLVARQQDEIRYKEVRIAQLVHEVVMLKRVRFGKKGEQLPGIQGTLLEDTVAADLAAVQAELGVLKGAPLERKKMGQAKRTPLPAHLPRIDILHEPESSVCKCGCQLLRIGEDVAEKLDYTPGAFTVERHIRGKWVCKTCTTLVQ